MKQPANLSPELSELWAELALQVKETTPPLALEALCRQVMLMRDAARRIQDEGSIVIDAKGNASEHPALRVEREAGKQAREWLAKYGQRDPVWP